MSDSATRKLMIQKLKDLGFVIPNGQVGIALEYFLERPDQDIDHSDAVPWIQGSCHSRLGEACKDPDRAIRRLADMKIIRKVSKGVYRFEPDNLYPTIPEEFDNGTKIAALERDHWKCVVCGQGKAEGLELQVDHIVPRANGGSGDLENAQTLCGKHNYMKKKLDQLAFGKKLFKRARDRAKEDLASSPDAQKIVSFCDEVLAVYEKYNID
jgi:hypothetical protein